MENDKTRWVLRWASKGCESSWKPAGSSCTKREPQELTPAKTRQGARRLPLSCLSIHRTRCRRTPFGSGYHRVLSSVFARLLPAQEQTNAEPTHRAALPACASKGPSQPRKPASTPDLDSERGDGASLMPTSVDDVPPRG